ncbi:DUF1064 domain-containing protein [Armatimonas sp.]|uniref:DUF1064 domain-containing protein n=1 Tax=Armatimonas sp. TaxID=1872638 RepID=UPI00374DCADA
MRLKAGSVPDNVDRIPASALAGKVSAGAKYGNRKTEQGGILFDSALEAYRWQELCIMQAGRLISELRRQVAYELVVEGVRICAYRADFVYVEATSGQVVVEDAKGHATGEYRLKKRLMKALYCLEIVEIRKKTGR